MWMKSWSVKNSVQTEEFSGLWRNWKAISVGSKDKSKHAVCEPGRVHLLD